MSECMGCKGTGTVIKMPEGIKKPCRLCNGTGKGLPEKKTFEVNVKAEQDYQIEADNKEEAEEKAIDLFYKSTEWTAKAKAVKA